MLFLRRREDAFSSRALGADYRRKCGPSSCRVDASKEERIWLLERHCPCCSGVHPLVAQALDDSSVIMENGNREEAVESWTLDKEDGCSYLKEKHSPLLQTIQWERCLLTCTVRMACVRPIGYWIVFYFILFKNSRFRWQRKQNSIALWMSQKDTWNARMKKTEGAKHGEQEKKVLRQ